jgi:FMN-dependent oxidoreductase (nitrilotriacetate monooxygenase family)
MKGKQLHLNLFILGVGHHEGVWRDGTTSPESLYELDFYRGLAQVAEAGKFDSLFLADIPSLAANIRYNPPIGLEPITTISSLSAATEKIGLIATVSTTYFEPYNVARLFASLDHLSGGRTGWNIVTTSVPATAYNFGRSPHAEHSVRYARSREFVDVVTRLWDSWEEDAIILDREAGHYADPEKIHDIDHRGTTFQVKGALNIPRVPQGRPVLVQAGSSEDGKQFAARYAEAIFTSQFTVEEARLFYSDVKSRAERLGRDPEEIKILPGIIPILGSTEEEARGRAQELMDLTRPEAGLAALKTQLGGVDLSDHPLDEPFPDIGEAHEAKGGRQRFELIVNMARQEHLTLREVLQRLAGGHGHRVFVGTPEQLADEFELWLATEAADGFNLMPPTLPGSFETFVDEVVPLLQRRGIFREDYSGSTLREHYGLRQPRNQFSDLAPVTP